MRDQNLVMRDKSVNFDAYWNIFWIHPFLGYKLKCIFPGSTEPPGSQGYPRPNVVGFFQWDGAQIGAI